MIEYVMGETMEIYLAVLFLWLIFLALSWLIGWHIDIKSVWTMWPLLLLFASVGVYSVPEQKLYGRYSNR